MHSNTVTGQKPSTRIIMRKRKGGIMFFDGKFFPTQEEAEAFKKKKQDETGEKWVVRKSPPNGNWVTLSKKCDDFCEKLPQH